MAADRAQAQRDLRAKMRLEAQLQPRLRSADRDLARQVTVQLGITGQLPNVEQITETAYSPVFAQHYDSVSREFGDLIRPQLPSDVESSSEEDAAILALLLAANRERVRTRVPELGATNAEDATFALSMAEETAREDGLSRQELATTTGVLFLRKIIGRETTRTVSETETPAEDSKQIEAQELLGPGGESIKEWVTVGDDVVRPHHREVDSDRVPIDAPFRVNRELLMFPGDTSLGATASNTAGCRCSSVPDVAAIVASRR